MSNLWSKQSIFLETNSSGFESNQSLKLQGGKLGLEKIRLFDGSELSGELIKLDDGQNLFWENHSVSKPISFDYKSVSNIFFNRLHLPHEQIPPHLKSLTLYFRNGDKLRCKYEQLTKDHLLIETGCAGSIKIPLSAIQKLEFLPNSYFTLYDSSFGFENWKKSNSKSWIFEEGDFVSSFSGSVGMSLPKKEAIEIQFIAEWERSFYLAIRIFSDSDGSTYGNEGYHLSFSNNRLNLQVNKRRKGRTLRETIGSIMVNDLMKEKEARFKILGHRSTKEFIIFVNDQQIARWKDSTEGFHPNQNGILFINQGGNSYIRLKEVNISGWNKSLFPPEDSKSIAPQDSTHVVLENGDSTLVSSITGDKESISMSTKRGTFNVPILRVRNIIFTKPKDKLLKSETSEQILLTQSLGLLSCKLLSISKNQLSGYSPNFGDFTLSLNTIRQIKCNQHLLRRSKYIEGLNEVKKALDLQRPEDALSALENLPFAQRSWYWHRLSFLARTMESEEILSFTPHPDKTLITASFAGNEDTILSTSKEGEYALWSGHAKLASGSYSNHEKIPTEIGRFLNEEQYSVNLSHPYWLSETEVTETQFKAVTSQKLWPEKNGSLPMVCNWFEAQKFCNQLNQLEKPPNGYIWRLPTEAEWEYACRAESQGPFCNSKFSLLNNNESKYEEHLNKYGWFAKNSNGAIHPVKQKLPNSFGLYDMHGNVWEWCLDSTMTDKSMLLKTRIPGVINPYTSKGDWRILRGGCYDLKFDRCRSSYRGANAPSVVNGDRGFRIALGINLNKEHNSTKNIISKEIIKLEKLGLKLLPISPKTFLMGSPSNLTAPKAITNFSGDKLFTGSIEGNLGTTDFSGQPIQQIKELNSTVTSISSSSDDQWVIAGCNDGSVHLFNGKSFTLKKTLHDHKFPVTSVSISPNGKRFSTSSLGGKLNSYSFPDCTYEWSVFAKDQNASFDYLEYNSKGTKLLSSGIGSIPKLFQAKNGKEIKLNPFPYNEVMRSRFLKNGESFASITQSGMLIFTEASNGLVYKVVRLQLQNLFDFDFSPYGKRMIFSTKEGTCSIRKTPINNTLCIESGEKTALFSPDYFFALAKKTEPNQTKLSDFLSNYGFLTQDGLNQQGCKTSPSEKLVLTTLDGALRLWDSETGIWITTLGDKFVTPFEDCAFSPDGTMVVGKLKTNEFLIYLTSNQLPVDPDNNKNQSEVETWF
ncbi:MAG: SUMF1/EgtB/PvdO family nonheme iron enzyme [Opitutae bacterium]|nr:SUMF1/EgtB/PvdO family nonheme iron enzyme [Opitutae bacterium]